MLTMNHDMECTLMILQLMESPSDQNPVRTARGNPILQHDSDGETTSQNVQYADRTKATYSYFSQDFQTVLLMIHSCLTFHQIHHQMRSCQRMNILVIQIQGMQQIHHLKTPQKWNMPQVEEAPKNLDTTDSPN